MWLLHKAMEDIVSLSAILSINNHQAVVINHQEADAAIVDILSNQVILNLQALLSVNHNQTVVINHQEADAATVDILSHQVIQNLQVLLSVSHNQTMVINHQEADAATVDILSHRVIQNLLHQTVQVLTEAVVHQVVEAVQEAVVRYLTHPLLLLHQAQKEGSVIVLFCKVEKPSRDWRAFLFLCVLFACF